MVYSLLPPPAMLERRKSKGFNLIEAAIVLGVVGLVIGGIWVAAATVNDYYKWKQTEEGWLYYMDLISKNFNVRTAAETRATGIVDIESPFLIRMPVPAGWENKLSACCGTLPTDPYGHHLFAQLQGAPYAGTVSIGYVSGTGSGYVSSRALCIKIERFIVTRMDTLYHRVFGGPSASCATDLSACCPGGVGSLGGYYELPVN